MRDGIAQRVARVQERISDAAHRTGRSPDEVLLVAVTKTCGLDAVEAACAAGLRHFGENRVEEAGPKIAAAASRLPADVTWHMIGHIQSRKSAEVAAIFPWVHSVDRLKVAQRLSRDALAAGRLLEVLLEVNISGEATKYGFDLVSWPQDALRAGAFFADVEVMLALPGLQVQGLMTMAPLSDDPEASRPIFRQLRRLRDALRQRFPHIQWPHLSMGMTADFEVAVEEGATMVRVGTAIFGPRG